MAKPSRVLGLTCVCVCVAASASGAEFTPTLELGVLRTDNLTQTSVEPEAATVWQLIPGFTLMQDSTRFKANAAYRGEAFRYVQRSENEVFHQFDGTFQAAIVPDRFFFDFGAARSQVIVDPQQQVPVKNVMINGNNVDRDEIYAGSSFAFPTGGNSVTSGELRRTKYAFADPVGGGLDDYDYDTVEVGADNYARRSGATWAARYNSEQADYQLEGIPYEYRQASLELGFWVSDVWRLFASGGKETPWDDPLTTSLEDSFWEAGFAQSSDKFSAEFAAGERTFGSSRRGEFSYSFDRGDTSFNYSETPTTTSADRYRFGGLLDPDQPPDYLYSAGALERYILNRLQWDFALDMPRLGTELIVYDEVRTDRTDAFGAPLPEQAQTGGSLSVTWKVGPKLELRVFAEVVDREFTDELVSDLTRGSLTGDYQLGSRTRLTVSLERWTEESEQVFGAANYEANVISATVARTFR